MATPKKKAAPKGETSAATLAPGTILAAGVVCALHDDGVLLGRRAVDDGDTLEPTPPGCVVYAFNDCRAFLHKDQCAIPADQLGA